MQSAGTNGTWRGWTECCWIIDRGVTAYTTSAAVPAASAAVPAAIVQRTDSNPNHHHPVPPHTTTTTTTRQSTTHHADAVIAVANHAVRQRLVEPAVKVDAVRIRGIVRCSGSEAVYPNVQAAVDFNVVVGRVF